MTFDYINKILVQTVKKLYGVEESFVLEHPSNEKWGDYATSLPLVLAKKLGKSPIEVAQKITYELNNVNHTFDVLGMAYNMFEKIYAAPPGFVNFVLSKEWLLSMAFEVLNKKERFGSLQLGQGKTVLVEYSQPNPNKPMHIGHARNNFLGSAISKFLEFAGYRVIKSNYVGDIGIHICKSMLMYKKYGRGKEPDIKSDHFVGKFYIMFEQESEKNPDLLNEAQVLLRKWESGDPETLALWKKMNNWAYDGWKKTYADEKVEFDIWEFESESIHIGKEIAEMAVEKGIAQRQADGSIIARLQQYGLPDKILLRSDGTAVYATKDLQLAYDSYKKYKFDERLYVVDARQSDYFKQFFKVLQYLGFDWAQRLHHISYGFVKLPEGNMSSRKGLVVNADDVYETLIKLEENLVNKDLSNHDDAVREVALGAFKYALLKYDTASTITFDYEEVTKFEGNTGPYLQYTYARIQSILSKSEVKLDSNSFDYLVKDLNPDEKEMQILRHLYIFPEIITKSANEFAPNYICGYLFDLAQKFNTFYNANRILNEPNADLKTFRLLLASSSAQVLSNGLTLLGIETPERM